MKTFHLVVLLAILILESKPVSAQKDKISKEIKNAIYADAGVGPMMAITINYETRIWINEPESFQLRLRTGLLFGGIFLSDEFRGVIVNTTALFGEGTNHFEVTAGCSIGYWAVGTFSYGSGQNFGVFPLIDIGYRFEPTKSGIIFRAKIGSAGLGIWPG